MTHPVTPREKVAQIIKEKVSGPHFTDPSHFVAMEQDRFIAADAILNALASGSGDHAELARLADMADWMADGDPGANGSVLLSASVASEHASDLKALLAEITALRAANTEAERKLAEADQVIRDIAGTPYTGADWPRSRAATHLASKEAERG